MPSKVPAPSRLTGTTIAATASLPADPAPTPAATGADSRRWLMLAVVGLAQLMIVLDVTVVNIALPSAQQDLHFSNADRQWVVTAYTLAFGGLLLLGGRIVDFVGRKKTFIVGLIGFAGASALGGAAGQLRHAGGARACRAPSARCSPRPRCRC